MTTGTGDGPEPSASACRHHWIVQTPQGRTSVGVCKRCGSTRKFPNSAADAAPALETPWMGRWANRRGGAIPGAGRKRP